MSSIKYIIGQYTRVNSFIRSRGCAALDRINEFTREYCPITYTKFYALCVFRTAVAYTVILLTTETILNILHPSRFINSREMLVFHHVGLFFLDSLLYMCGGILYDIRQWHDYFWRIIIRIWPKNVWKILPCPVLTLECRVIVRKQHGSIKQRFETYFMQIKCVSFSSYLLYTCFVTLPLKRGSQHILWNINDDLLHKGNVVVLSFIYTSNNTCAEETSWRTQITRHSWICLTEDTVVVFH